MEGTLKDLEVNVVLRCDDSRNKTALEREPPISAVLNNLEQGQTYYKKRCSGNNLLSLELDWFEFCGIALECQSISSVTRTHRGTAVVVSTIDQTVVRLLATCHGLILHLNRMVCEDELCLISKFWLCSDSSSIYIKKPDFQALYTDLNAQQCLFHHSWPQPLTPGPRNPLSHPGLRGCTTLSPSAPNVTTLELHLTKTQVTYLIGVSGTRIETTRELSQATVKVIPVPDRAKSTTQTIAITGTPLQMARALALLEAQLALYRFSKGRVT